MTREITDNGVTWSCVEAYTGLSGDDEKLKAAAQVDEKGDKYWVVCTPSSAAKSVRLELDNNWEESLNDEELLDQIKQRLEG